MPTIKDVILGEGITDFSEAERFAIKELELMQEDGNLALGEDKDLTGRALELRVYELFKSHGYNISPGSPSREDFVVLPGPSFAFQDKVAVEVKSSRHSQLSLENLRQLDDWVYDLSGEEQARKHGLGGGIDPLAMITNGLMSRAKRHPNPHKGLLIFNGPVGAPFTKRAAGCMHPNLRDFAASRNFCVFSLIDFIAVMSKGSEDAWNAIHSTVGEYSP